MTAPGVFHVHFVGAASLSIVLRPRGGDWLQDDMHTLNRVGVNVLASMLTPEEEEELELGTEEACCSKAGMDYLSVPIADLGVPTDSATFEDAVRKVVAALQQGQSVAVHCRMSIGRSAMLTCASLVALGFPIDKAISTVSRARGLKVPETPQQRQWLEQNAEKFSKLMSSE
jgi:protein-tyrosine phosphatase